jgi:hypothetical protein
MTETEMIMAMDEDDFRDLVDRDLRRKNTAEEAEALRSPALVDRWYTVLVAMGKSVEGQLSAKRQDLDAQKAKLKQQFFELDAQLEEARRRHDKQWVRDTEEKSRKLRSEWASATERFAKERAATLRFKSGLDETLIEAKLYRDKIRDRLYEHVIAEERNRLATRVRHLESALKQIAWSEDPSANLARTALGEPDE